MWMDKYVDKSMKYNARIVPIDFDPCLHETVVELLGVDHGLDGEVILPQRTIGCSVSDGVRLLDEVTALPEPTPYQKRRRQMNQDAVEANIQQRERMESYNAKLKQAEDDRRAYEEQAAKSAAEREIREEEKRRERNDKQAERERRYKFHERLSKIFGKVGKHVGAWYSCEVLGLLPPSVDGFKDITCDRVVLKPREVVCLINSHGRAVVYSNLYKWEVCLWWVDVDGQMICGVELLVLVKYLSRRTEEEAHELRERYNAALAA
jgi:hypothetical protein